MIRINSIKREWNFSIQIVVPFCTNFSYNLVGSERITLCLGSVEYPRIKFRWVGMKRSEDAWLGRDIHKFVRQWKKKCTGKGIFDWESRFWGWFIWAVLFSFGKGRRVLCIGKKIRNEIYFLKEGSNFVPYSRCVFISYSGAFLYRIVDILISWFWANKSWTLWLSWFDNFLQFSVFQIRQFCFIKKLLVLQIIFLMVS